MSAKSPSLGPSTSTPIPNHGSKLPKFLQKTTRDRSKSVGQTDPGSSSSGSSSAFASSSSSNSSQMPDSTLPRRRGTSKLLSVKERSDKSRQSQDFDRDREGDDVAVLDDFAMEETPVIIEPPSPSFSRSRSERGSNPPSDPYSPPTLMSSPSARITDLPSRLSGWFSHTFSNSTQDLSLPTLLSQSQASSSAASPKGKNSALLTAAKHGKGHLDKAMRYLMDSDATPDRCPDPIWLLGVQHPGYEPPPRSSTPPPRRGSSDSRRSPAASSLHSASSNSSPTLAPADLSSSGSKNPSAHWPPVFYADFTSRIWLTYRSHFLPIRDSSLTALESEIEQVFQLSSSPPTKRWNWPLGGEKGWTSDAGWGCMLRTGQSLLANALLHLHLGRDWRRPPAPVRTADYAMYVKLITWFLDSPSPLCPFSVHRMALAGKDLGKDVGQWFGPSTAANAIKRLVHAFPDANLGVSVAADSVVYQSDVFAASRGEIGSPRKYRKSAWGERGVLVLVGIRLGLEGVNPIYYDAIKALYTFPQSVGIAGGRPSSSYYFVGSQSDNLFYLDPHHSRPAIPLRPPPYDETTPGAPDSWERTESLSDWENNSTAKRSRQRSTIHGRSPTSPASSIRTGSSAFSYHPKSPISMHKQLSTSSNSSSNSGSHGRWRSATISSPIDVSEFGSRDFFSPEAELDPLQEHYVNAYSYSELKTFHCDRVRKMPLSGLDPSMLLGFFCKDENDWNDFRQRVADLSRNHKTMFSVQDEPPDWPSSSEDFMALESISEPDMDMGEPEDEDEDQEEDEVYADARSTSDSPGASVRGKGSEVDTEEDPIGPITPGPNSRSTFEIDDVRMRKEGSSEMDEDEELGGKRIGTELEDEDDWLDPSLPTPLAQPSQPQAAYQSDSNEGQSRSSSNGKKQGKRPKRTGSNPLKSPFSQPPEQHYPFPVTVESPEDSLISSRVLTANGKRMPQMRTAKARDGGRTQSGGVRGVPTDDS